MGEGKRVEPQNHWGSLYLFEVLVEFHLEKSYLGNVDQEEMKQSASVMPGLNLS